MVCIIVCVVSVADITAAITTRSSGSTHIKYNPEVPLPSTSVNSDSATTDELGRRMKNTDLVAPLWKQCLMLLLSSIVTCRSSLVVDQLRLQSRDTTRRRRNVFSLSRECYLTVCFIMVTLFHFI